MSLQATEPRLILASQSTARRDLMAAAGLLFETRPAAIDEQSIKQGARAEGQTASELALLLAEIKAARVARSDPEALVIGCDQVLVCEDRWFDKPVDLAEAAQHLAFLRGRTHTLVTAVVCQRGQTRLWHHVDQPRLVMREFSDAFLEAYILAEGHILTTTVGAYRLEGLGIQLFDQIEGQNSSILGLPMQPLLGFLRQHQAILT